MFTTASGTEDSEQGNFLLFYDENFSAEKLIRFSAIKGTRFEQKFSKRSDSDPNKKQEV